MNEPSKDDSLTPENSHQRIQSLISQAREALGVDSAVARELSLHAYDLALTSNDHAGRAAALLEMGRADHRLGQLNLALESLLAAVKGFEELNVHTLQLETLTLIGQVYRELGALDLASHNYQEALKLSRELGQDNDQAKALNGAAGIEYQQGHYEQALGYMEQVLEIYQRLEDFVGQASCRSNIGMLHTQLGNYPEALKHLLESYSLTNRFVHDARSEGNCLINIGRLYEQIHDLQQARNYYEKALVIGKKAGERSVVVTATINLGTVYHSLKEFDWALEKYKIGLQISREMGFRQGEIASLDGLAQLYGESGQPEQARQAHLNSIRIAREIGDRDQEIDTLINLGKMHLRVNEYDDALRSLQEALRLALESQRKRAAFESHLWLVNAFESLGDYRQALEHHREFHRLERELQGEESEEKVKKLSARLDLEQARNEAEVLRLNNAVVEQARDAAEDANRAKSNFLSRMSHELRTPLNAIMGFAQLLTVAKLELKHQQSAERIFRAGQYLLKLVNEVLDIAQIEAGKMTLIIEPVLLRNAILGGLELVKPLSRERKIIMHASVHKHWMVRADRHRLDQVLLNLFSNAVKYNHENGRIDIYCETREDTKVRVWVVDTGKGMTSEQIQRLFNPFERVGAERSNVPGAGLGLAIVKQLLEAMGGSVGVESEIGQGSRFWFELPLVDSSRLEKEPNTFSYDESDMVPNQTLNSELENSSNSSSHPHQALDAAPENTSQSTIAARIVCLEPALRSSRLLELILSQRANTNVYHAQITEDVLRLTEQYKPNLVLVSDQLGSLALFELLAEFQKRPKIRNIPVTVLSSDLNKASHFLEAGAWRIISRPFDVNTILTSVDDALEVQT